MNNPRSYVGDDYQRTRLEIALDFVSSWKFVIVVGVIAAFIFARLGWLDMPDLSDLHKLLILAFIGGYIIIGQYAVWPQIEGRIEPATIPLYLTGLDGDRILDILYIPEDEWWRFESINGLAERYTLGGNTVFVARAVDLKNNLIVAAGDRPSDDDIPDYIDLIGSGASAVYHKLRGEVIEEYREGTNRERDEKIQQEQAMRQATNQWAEFMEGVRAGNIDIRGEEEAEQELQKVDSAIRDLATEARKEDTPGDSDE